MTLNSHRTEAVRGLWLARELPFPLDSGDRIYAARLARSLAEAGADLTFVGHGSRDRTAVPTDWPVRLHAVPGGRHSRWRGLLSPLPLVAALHATRAYRRQVEALAREPFDFIVLDHYGTGWALPLIRANLPRGRRPVLVHVSHNHEASLSRQLAREFRGSAVKRLGFLQNHWKIRASERALVRGVDLVTAITEEDAALYETDAPGIPSLVLKPGYDGSAAPRGPISADTPRRAVMVGSYHWEVKQENLRRFVAAADPLFRMAGIELHVAGSMPSALAAELSASASSVRIHGFVEDIGPLFDAARIAVVPEAIGGGFKLKFLDYVFGRMPVATLSQAVAGVPAELRAAMLCRDDPAALAAGIVELMDAPERLNRMREEALAGALARFRWEDRGRALLREIGALQSRGARTADGDAGTLPDTAVLKP
jgi:glycosyltransferase involved in cell wall biosynthesis